MHFISKLRSTLSILATLFMARTFGELQNNGWNGEFDFATYRWRGSDWTIPLSRNDGGEPC